MACNIHESDSDVNNESTQHAISDEEKEAIASLLGLRIDHFKVSLVEGVTRTPESEEDRIARCLASEDYKGIFIQAVKSLTTVWRHTLSSAAYQVLDFYVGRTLRWGKLGEEVPMPHLLDGVWDNDTGVLYEAGIKANKATILKGIRELESLGVITVHKKRSNFQKKNIHHVMHIVLDPLVFFGRYVDMLKEAKNPRNPVSTVKLKEARMSRQNRPAEGNINITKHNIKTKPNAGDDSPAMVEQPVLRIRRTRASATAFETSPPTPRADAPLRELVEATANATKTKQDGKALRNDSRMTTIMAVWRKALQQHYEGLMVVNITGTEFGIFRHNYKKANGDPDQASAVVAYAVEYWDNLRDVMWSPRQANGQHLPAPLQPDFLWAAKHISKILKSFARNDFAEQKIAREANLRNTNAPADVAILKAALAAAKRQADKYKAEVKKLERIAYYEAPAKSATAPATESKYASMSDEELFEDMEMKWPEGRE